MTTKPTFTYTKKKQEIEVNLIGFKNCKDYKQFSQLGKSFGTLILSNLDQRQGRYKNKITIPRNELNVGVPDHELKDTLRQVFSELSSYRIKLVNTSTGDTKITSLVSTMVLGEASVEFHFPRSLTGILGQLAESVLPALTTSQEATELEITVGNQTDTLF